MQWSRWCRFWHVWCISVGKPEKELHVDNKAKRIYNMSRLLPYLVSKTYYFSIDLWSVQWTFSSLAICRSFYHHTFNHQHLLNQYILAPVLQFSAPPAIDTGEAKIHTAWWENGDKCCAKQNYTRACFKWTKNMDKMTSHRNAQCNNNLHS